MAPVPPPSSGSRSFLPPGVLRLCLGSGGAPLPLTLETVDAARFLQLTQLPGGRDVAGRMLLDLAVRRLVGWQPDQNPYEQLLRRSFPDGTEAGKYLEQIVVEQLWRPDGTSSVQPVGRRSTAKIAVIALLEEASVGGSPSDDQLNALEAKLHREERALVPRDERFPQTVTELVVFLRFLLGQTYNSVEIREKLRRMIGTPPPLSARVAGRRPPTPPPPSAAARRTPMPKPASPDVVDHFELTAHLICELERHGAPSICDTDDLRKWLRHAEDLGVPNSRLFIGHHAELKLLEELKQELERATSNTGAHFLVSVHRTRLVSQLAMRMGPDRFQKGLERYLTVHELKFFGASASQMEEAYYARLASVLAAKESILRLLHLQPEEHWQDVEFREGQPVLTGRAKEGLGNRSIIATTAACGDLAIGIAILEPTLGQSGLEKISLNLSTDHEGVDGGIRVGSAVASLTLTDLPRPEVELLEPFLSEIAARLGKEPAAVREEATRSLSHIRLFDRERYLAAARSLMERGSLYPEVIWQGNPTNRDGMTLLRLIGLGWNEINTLVPGSQEYYERHARIAGDAVCRRGGPGYEYPVGSTTPLVTGFDPGIFSQVMAIEPGHRVLDLMTGNGRKVVEVAKAHPQARILAVELNPDNLLQAVSFASAAKIPPANLTFLLHDVRDPLPSDNFDRIMMTGYSTFGFDSQMLETLYREIFRAIRSGGRIWIDYGHYYPPVGRDHLEAFRGYATGHGIALVPVPVPDDLPNAHAFMVIKDPAV